MQMIQEMDETVERLVSLIDPGSLSFPKKFGIAMGNNAQVAIDD